MGGPLEFSSWGCPEVLGLAPHSVWGGGGAESQCLSHSDSGSTRNSGQGVGWSWWLGQQEIECSRRVWQPILANMLQYSCLENPLSDKEAWQATVHRIAKSWTQPKWPCMHRGKIFFCLWQLCPSEAVQLLGLWEPWWHQVCRDTDCLCHRSYGLFRVFFPASCSWRSEGLFGQSFSIIPPVQALRGFPCPGSFSVVQHVRHIEEHPWLGFYTL